MDKLTIVKIGGKIVEESDDLNRFLTDFSQIDGLKLLVHGGGSLATKIAAQLGIESRMIDGRRITDAEMLKVVAMVYAGWVNKMIVARLQALGINAVGLTGADMNVIQSVKRPVQTVDYGFAGDIEQVDKKRMEMILLQDIVPVLAPLTHDKQGNLLNTNADTIAAETAKALAGLFDVTLMYCFEKSGVLRDEADDGSVIRELDRDLYMEYKKKGIIQGGMIPKLDNAFHAIHAGVKRVVITKSTAIQGDNGTMIRSRL